jgi:hypothetical protein
MERNFKPDMDERFTIVGIGAGEFESALVESDADEELDSAEALRN